MKTDSWLEEQPDIPGCRNRARRWYCVVLDGGMRMEIEEQYGERYLVPRPPLVKIITD